MMDEKELAEYMKLADKAEESQLSFEELTKLNELHVVFLKKSYEIALKNAEEQSEIQDSLELIKQSLEEKELLNTILTAFIEEKGLTNEFYEFLDIAIAEGIEETPSLLN